MRFSCDRCDAQYMISDEKVGPNGVKVRCKKCGHVILVRRLAAEEAAAPEPPAQIPGAAPGGSGEHALDAELGHAFDAAFGAAAGAPETAAAPAAPAPAPDPDATQAVSPEEAAGLAARSAAPEPAATEWYVAIGQAQVGPLPLAEVRRKWEAGDVGPDSLVWRPGMGDWAPLTGVPDLAAYLAPVPHGTARPRPAEAPAQPAPRTSTVVAAPAAQAPRGDVSWKPVGASALAALASEEMAAQAPAPKPEAKAAPAAGSLVDGLPDGGGVDPTGAIPLQIKALEQTGEAPVERRSTVARGAAELRKKRSSARTVAALVAVVLVAVLAGGGYLAYDRYLRPASVPPLAPAEAPPAPSASAAQPAPAPPPPAPQPSSQPAAEAPAQPPAAEPAPPGAAVAAAPAPPPAPREPEPARKKTPAKAAPSHPARAEKAKETPAKVVAKAEPPPAAPAAAPAKKKGNDLLDFDANDSALDEALGSKPSGRSVYVPPAPGGETLPDRVSDSQVNETIMTRVSALQQCLADSKSSGSGVLKMRWSIAPDGSVQNLKAISPENAATRFAGCVTDVLKELRFPKTAQGRSEVTFPFKY
ncbi:MAG TPA: GYF domain-containing protein [Anaeromyxobacter sp.]|nr:GYF domain-containing protein [Anaeromyxobacter sp.]